MPIYTQYLPNELYKGIKFFVSPRCQKYVPSKRFPYLGKNEASGSNMPLSKFVVYKLTEPYLGCGRT